ncbi:MAG: hypothetical protein ACPGWR_19225 [Ardenticatenaceae bacterium]
MNSKSFGNFFISSIVLSVVLLLVFGFLQWLELPTGRFIDWLVGIASFWWLLVIVTVPWNIHFRAKEVLEDAAKSVEKAISVKPEEIEYVKIVSQRSLLVAIALHLLSAIALYLLAYFGISAVGYLSSGAALLLTILRPAVRAYEYLARRLNIIGEELKYPREDVVKLRQRVATLEEEAKELAKQIDPQKPDSWAATQQRHLGQIEQQLNRLRLALEELKATNQTEHQRLSREAKQAIAQLTTDGQFLDHVREIIRFIKNA